MEDNGVKKRTWIRNPQANQRRKNSLKRLENQLKNGKKRKYDFELKKDYDFLLTDYDKQRIESEIGVLKSRIY